MGLNVWNKETAFSLLCVERKKESKLIRRHLTGIPKIMATSRTLKTEIVSSTEKELVFKLQQEYRPKAFPTSKTVNSLVSLALERDEQGTERVVYHKDMWNEKDYSHEGLGKVMKTLNGDHLTKITQPPKSL